MHRPVRLVLVLALLAAGPARAEIREISALREIVPSLDRDTLLVFDIDNTLIEPTSNLGSDQWYYYLLERLVARGLSRAEAERRAVGVWNDVQWLIEVRAVEKATPAIVATAQRRGVKTMVVTARTPDLAQCTVQQLASVGLRFAGVGPDRALRDGSARYLGGILYLGDGRDKGRLLLELLRSLRLAPKKIVFVDDKVDNVRNMERALAVAGVASRCFRYAATDGRVRAFQRDVADAQLFFGGEAGAASRAAIERARAGARAARGARGSSRQPEGTRAPAAAPAGRRSE